MDLSSIILSFNSARTLRNCLQSLLTSMDAQGVNGEIVVIDNGSKDESISIVDEFSQRDGRISLVAFPENRGTTKSRNLGIRRCAGERLLVMDSDAYMEADALRQLIARVDADPQLGIVAPRLIFPDGRPQMSVDQFPTLGRKLQRFLNLRRIERRTRLPDRQAPVDYAISAVWLFRREILETVGFLDERIFYAPEDVDYCMRVWLAGYRVDYLPEVSVVHDAQERSRRIIPNRFTFLHIQGLAYYFWKYGYLFSLRRIRRAIQQAQRG